MKFRLFFQVLFAGLIVQFIPVPAGAGTFPVDKLPAWITKLSDTGSRIEWSKDGKKLLYITKDGGDVQEMVIETRAKRTIAKGEYGVKGYYRCYYLVNGDYLLSFGAKRLDLRMEIRDRTTLNVLATFSQKVIEGVAMSRRSLKIAFTENQGSIDMADIVYNAQGIPSLSNITRVVPNGYVEPQDFRGPNDQELIFTCYGCNNHDIRGVNLTTKVITTYSAPGSMWKEEPEGIFPSGEQTLYESDELNGGCIDGCVDIYAMLLDGTGTNRVRLTRFQDFTYNGNKYKASNPAVRNNGQQFAFQEALAGDAPGVGRGIYIFDLQKFNYQWLSKETGKAIPPDTLQSTVGIKHRSDAIHGYTFDGLRNNAFSFTLPTAGRYSVEVYSVNGQKMQFLQNGFGVKGSNVVSLRADYCSPGLKLIRLTSDFGTIVTKVILSN